MGEKTLKPLVLLDIDGVINAYPSDDGLEAQRLLWRAGNHGWTVTVAHDTIRALRRVLPAAHEVLWCTAWRAEANEGPRTWLVEMMLLPEGKMLDVVSDGGGIGIGGFTVDWKLEAVTMNEKVIKARREGRPIYWIEDFNWHKKMPWIPRPSVEELGITGIDTGQVGRLTLEHLEPYPEFRAEGGSDFARRLNKTTGP